MSKKIGCLHAHYSNIDYIEQALTAYDVEFVHFVDPGLMFRYTSDENFTEADAHQHVKEQIEWMSKCDVDAILLTCTNYIALLREEELSLSIPIIKIDEPYFAYLCQQQEPQLILFTNPATVEGTIKRLDEYAKRQQKVIDYRVVVIEDTFDLMMKGLQKEYSEAISNYLEEVIQSKEKTISVAQLSMVRAAEQVSCGIINPLQTLVSALVEQLSLKKK